MYNYICVFFPSVISIMLDKHFLKSKYSLDTLLYYIFYCLINNVIVLTIFALVFKTKYDIWNCINLYPLMTTKYCAIALFISVVISYINIIIKKNMDFQIEIKKR